MGSLHRVTASTRFPRSNPVPPLPGHLRTPANEARPVAHDGEQLHGVNVGRHNVLAQQAPVRVAELTLLKLQLGLHDGWTCAGGAGVAGELLVVVADDARHWRSFL